MGARHDGILLVTESARHMETVDPQALADNPEFSNPSVTIRQDRSVVVSVVAQMFSFSPNPIEVPRIGR